MRKLITLFLISFTLSVSAQTYKTVTMALDTGNNVAKLRAGTQVYSLPDTFANYTPLQDGLIEGGEATIGTGSVTIDTAIFRINRTNYTSLPRTFTGIANSPSGTQYYLVVYGEIGGTLDTISGARDTIAVIPDNPVNTVKVNTVLVGDGGVESTAPDLSGYAKLMGGNTFTGNQKITGEVQVKGFIKLNRRLEFFNNVQDPTLPFPSSTPNFGIEVPVGQNNLKLTSYGGLGDVYSVGYTTSVLDFKQTPTINGVPIGSGGGTVTNVSALTLGTTGTDLNSSVTNPTTTPVITLNVPNASATNRGALSSTDWIRFDGKANNFLTGYSPSLGSVSAADSVQSAISKLDGSFQDAGISLPELGEIISDDFNRASLGSNYSLNGTGTFTISSNELNVINSGSFSTSNYIVRNDYGNSNLEAFTASIDIIAGTINSTSHGVGLNMQSNGTFSTTYSVQVGFNLSSTNTGAISIYQNNSTTPILTSINGMSITAGDSLVGSVKFIKDKFLITLFNKTTGRTNSLEYDVFTSSPFGLLTPNSFRYGILALGGTHKVDNFIVVGNDSKNISYLLIGDSITKGLSSDNSSNRWGELINLSSNTTTQTNAGASNKIEDINVNEILSLTPKNIIILIGINNFSAGDNLATVQTKYTTLIDSLTANGYTIGVNLYPCLLLPNTANSANVIAFNSWLISNYGVNNVIDFYTDLVNGIALRYTIDAIHPSNEGHKIMANKVITKLNIPSKPKKIGAIYPVIYNNNGKLIIGDNSFGKSVTPTYQLDVRDISGSNTTQIHAGNSISDIGAYIGSVSGSAYYLNNMSYTGSGYIAKAAQIAGLVMFQGDTYFHGQTGTTTGSAVSPTVRAFLQGSTGNFSIGNGASTPASAILSAVSTTKGFLPPTMTTAQFTAIGSKATGLEAYDSSLGRKVIFNGTTTRNVAYTDDANPANEITGISQTMVSNNRYIPNNASLVTLTLPSTSAVGDVIFVNGKGAGLWRVSQSTGQIIHGATDTTTGTAGFIQATQRYNCITLVCIVANTEWVIQSSQGTITIN